MSAKKSRRDIAALVAVTVLLLGWGVMAFLNYRPVRGVKPETVAKVEVAYLAKALHGYKNEHGEYPAEESWMDELSGYYSGEMIDPWGREYLYQNESGEVSVLSRGANPDDDEDDISKVVHVPRHDYESDSGIVGTMAYIFSGDENAPDIEASESTNGDTEVGAEEDRVPGVFEGTSYDPDKKVDKSAEAK